MSARARSLHVPADVTLCYYKQSESELFTVSVTSYDLSLTDNVRISTVKFIFGLFISLYLFLYLR